MSMILYRIREWSKRYENAQSRKCEQLHWLPLPARHDAERYCEIMARQDAAEIFSAWIICLQVGARSEPRGSLVRSDGSPHTPETLAIKTRGHQKWFEKALPYLSQIGWLEQVTEEYQSTTISLPVECESPGQEGRKESNERKKEASTKVSAESLNLEIPQSLSTAEFTVKWNEWVSFRMTLKKSKDWNAFFSKQLSELEKWGVDAAVASLTSSLLNEYQGLFFPKNMKIKDHSISKPHSIEDHLKAQGVK